MSAIWFEVCLPVRSISRNAEDWIDIDQLFVSLQSSFSVLLFDMSKPLTNSLQVTGQKTVTICEKSFHLSWTISCIACES